MSDLKNFETLQSLCKRRGYIFQSAEIYGGLNACWDYGPLGAQLKKNLAELWWKTMVRRSDIVGLDSAILSHPEVLKSSGHVSAFTDPLVDCLDCKYRFRLEDKKKCPQCGSQNITEPRPFNLMFKTHAGSIEDQGAVVYLRPETAQGIYVQFLNVQTSMRKTLPFGVAQIGKAFRNEITPGPFTFRTREFEQMEMQYFIHSKESSKWYKYWKETRLQFYEGILKNIRYREHAKDELAHYASQAVDIEYHFPIGWKELEGIHDRGQYDVKMHQEGSRKNLAYSTSTGEKIIPHVIETSVGLDRMWLALLCESYREEDVKEGEKRVVLGLPKKLAPIQVAFLPLSKKEPLIALAVKLRDQYMDQYFVDYDETGSIGKRYRRQDEIGTPLCVTIDFESLEDQQVTVRDRDKMTQDRVAVDQLTSYLNNKL
ncbi:MAG: glycine--tRNA ligase [Bdellovibrionales bacterium]|nr:glycine--tRNA ligase [Bdellovibrionales bacterium]